MTQIWRLILLCAWSSPADFWQMRSVSGLGPVRFRYGSYFNGMNLISLFIPCTMITRDTSISLLIRWNLRENAITKLEILKCSWTVSFERRSRNRFKPLTKGCDLNQAFWKFVLWENPLNSKLVCHLVAKLRESNITFIRWAHAYFKSISW